MVSGKGQTSESAEHGCTTVYQVELSLTVSIGDTGQTEQDGKEVCAISHRFAKTPLDYSHVIIPFPASCPQHEIMAQSPNRYRFDGELKRHLKSQKRLSPPSTEILSSISATCRRMMGELMSPLAEWYRAKTAIASSFRPRA
jgi:hypothetical protein